MSISRLISRLDRTATDPHRDRIMKKLLQGVWAIHSTQRVSKAKAAAYLYHYEGLLMNRNLLDEEHTNLRESGSQSSDVIEVIQYLKQNSQTSIADIRKHLERHPPHWLLNPTNRDVVDRVLQFCIQLWLFTRPDLSDDSLALQEAVRRPFTYVSHPPSAWLWLDFSAKTLRERGRFQFSYTSDIYEHLTFSSKSGIRVFAHASAIHHFEMIDDGWEPCLLSHQLLSSWQEVFFLSKANSTHQVSCQRLWER